MPEIGRYYTMSRPGDLSWSLYVWLVIESNGTHVVIQNPFASELDYGFEPKVVAVDDFEWTPAGEIAATMAKHQRRPLQ